MMKKQMKADAKTLYLKVPAEVKYTIDKKTGYTVKDNEEYQAELDDEYEEEETVGGGVSDPDREEAQENEPRTVSEKIMSFKNVMLLLAGGLVLLFLNN